MKRALAAFLLLSSKAFADGALPDSLALVLPADRPNEIIAATNFGLIVSVDDGGTFDWICEQAIGTNAYLYQVGPPPDDVLYALSLDGVSHSTDDGCSWQLGSTGSQSIATDLFPAANDAQRVFAIVQPPQGDASFVTRHVLESHDHGQTFPVDLYGADAGDLLTGIELSRTSPELWATLYQYMPVVGRIARSTDDGGTWTTLELGVDQIPRLLAIDPRNPNRVYLRLSKPNGGDALAVWDDTAHTLTVLKQLNDSISGFVLRADGSLVMSEIAGNTWLSVDGTNFQLVDSKSHLRGLGERGGTLYALADNYGDGWAVGTSSDDGKNWTHLFQYGQLRGIRNCGQLATTCAMPWVNLKTQLGIGPPMPKPTGCNCGAVEGGWVTLAVLALLRVARARRQ